MFACGESRPHNIVYHNLDIARDSERLTQIRFRDGVATRLDIAEAGAQVKSIEARLPELERERMRLVNALSLLLAEPPCALELELEHAVPIPPVPRRAGGPAVGAR